MHPALARAWVKHQLEDSLRHTHMVRADGLLRATEHRPGDHEHIALGAADIASRVLLYLPPRTAVVLGVLRHHVGQRKALRLARLGMHIARSRHVPARIARAPVVVELRPITQRQPRLWIEPVLALDARSRIQPPRIQALGHINRCLGLPRVQHCKLVETQFAQTRHMLDRRGTRRKELRAIAKRLCRYRKRKRNRSQQERHGSPY
ncbi:hypothetical protein SDC9_169742 [bioreactor metagenome]|uniref:Uncharacterized protein n=1 Tax=bioreactor metagenome TaxID=1076179 RepID=A0A645G984_9ZZZZ